MNISFCTSCSGRLYQLEEVFESNIKKILAAKGTEWIIVNFGHDEELHAFILSKLDALPHRFIYAREQTGHPWHLSVAKNAAHSFGSGDVLVNLDCDNYIGDMPEVVPSFFNNGFKALHMWSGTSRDGTCGRIAITRRLFDQLGGYDESFYPMGYQDRDLLVRAHAFGAKIAMHACDPGMAIPNTKEVSIKQCGTPGMVWEDYDRLNREKSERNLQEGILTANPGGKAKLKFEIWKGKLAF